MHVRMKYDPESRKRKKRAQLIDTLAQRIWRWELRRGIRFPFSSACTKAAALCLFATREEKANSLVWHNRAFGFYTSGEFIEYEPEISEEEIMEEVLSC